MEDGIPIKNYTEIQVSPLKLIAPGQHFRVPGPETRIGPDGEPGYVHDPKFLLNNPPEFNIPTKEAAELCKPLGAGQEQNVSIPSLQKIRNHIETSTARRDVKLFCVVYTYGGKVENTKAISETWGKRCDGILYGSDHSDLNDGHVHIPGDTKYGFTYRSMHQRIQAMKAYVYDNFLDEYDFFHFCGDDVYMIVENMKEFLASEKVRAWDASAGKVTMAGFWMHWSDKDFGTFPGVGKFYLNGGPGYTFSRKALKAYVEGPMEICEYEDTAAEDLKQSDCLWDWRNNYTESNAFIDTRDEDGAHRYHSLDIGTHAGWPDVWSPGFITTKVLPRAFEYLEKEFGFPYVTRDAYISKSSVSFHKHSPTYLRRMEMLLYKNIDQDCSTT